MTAIDLNDGLIRQFLEAMASSPTPEIAVSKFWINQVMPEWKEVGPLLHLFFAEFSRHDNRVLISQQLREELYRRRPHVRMEDSPQCATKAKVIRLAARFMNDLKSPDLQKRLIEIYDVVAECRQKQAAKLATFNSAFESQRQRMIDGEAALRAQETEVRVQKFANSPSNFKTYCHGREVVVTRSTYVRLLQGTTSAEDFCAKLNVATIDLRKMMASGWRYAGNEFGVMDLDDEGLAALQIKADVLRKDRYKVSHLAKIGTLRRTDPTLHSSAFHHGMLTMDPVRTGKRKVRTRIATNVLGGGK